MGRVDEYLEKKGIRHLMALVTFMYIVGTIIFNIYLRSLGIFEFELIQLRYVFVGLVFSGFTGIIVTVIFSLYFIYRQIVPLANKKKKSKKQRSKENSLREIIFFVFLIPWIVGYAFYFFPEIPSGFGGAKPIEARLIGEKDTILKVNSLIAHETGVDEGKLPFEMVSDDTNLAIGANVKILDRNRDRILLILTKDLYLSSTSTLAKNLIEAGTSTEEIETEETKNFTQKSLLVKADKIESITFSLYEPPEILTKQDLEIASQVLSKDEEQGSLTVSNREIDTEKEKKQADIVEKFIVQQVPEAATKILEAVKKAPKVVSMASPNIVSQTEYVPVIDSKENISSIEEKLQDTSQAEPVNEGIVEELQVEEEIPEEDSYVEVSLESVLGEFIDPKFIDYRAQFYMKASELHEVERFSEKLLLHERFLLSKRISDTFRREYPDEWKQLEKDNYLALGQSEKRFLWKLMEVFRGTEGIEILIERINTTVLDASEIEKQEEVKAIIHAQENESNDILEDESEEILTAEEAIIEVSEDSSDLDEDQSIDEEIIEEDIGDPVSESSEESIQLEEEVIPEADQGVESFVEEESFEEEPVSIPVEEEIVPEEDDNEDAPEEEPLNSETAPTAEIPTE